MLFTSFIEFKALICFFAMRVIMHVVERDHIFQSLAIKLIPVHEGDVSGKRVK